MEKLPCESSDRNAQGYACEASILRDRNGDCSSQGREVALPQLIAAIGRTDEPIGNRGNQLSRL